MDTLMTETEAQSVGVGDRVQYRGRTGTVTAIHRTPGTGQESFSVRFDLELDNGDGLHGMDYKTLSISPSGPFR